MPVNRNDFKIGVMYRREYPPETLRAFAQRTEAAGFDELWVVEDCFFASGIAAAASALAFTEKITIGLGIMPAVARNVAFTAMEIATLARTFPDRFLPGIGHGVSGWMRQIGAFPKSQLAALEEVSLAVRALLAGENVTTDGRHVRLDDVQLVFPPKSAPPVSLGVRGPESLALAGRSADGTILSEYSSPAYVRWAREQIARGQQAAGRSDKHRITVYTFCAVDADGQAARDLLRPHIVEGIASGNLAAYLTPLGILQEAEALLAAGGAEHLAAEMPDEWIEQMAVAGTPEACVAAIHALVEAGADSIVLVPMQGQNIDALERIISHILPLLS